MSRPAPRATLPGVFLRGMMMGAADIVPGVSGGTIAFITGIYDRLLGAIAAIDLKALGLLRRGAWRAAWEHVDGTFLAVLLGGILTSMLSLAHLISVLLEEQPLRLWSFFFGLILASALLLLRSVSHWHGGARLGLVCGAVLAVGIGLSPALSLPPLPVSFLFAGAVAICAMILPGISGSFILVLLGLYPELISAVRDLHWQPLLLFAVGAGVGLMLFSRVLHYLLATHHATTLATLTGFLIGSLPLLWPWKELSESAAGLQLLSPWRYAAQVGDPQWLSCLLLAACGLFVVWLIEYRWGGAER